MLTICAPTKDAVVQKITKFWSSQILNEQEQRRHDFFLNKKGESQKGGAYLRVIISC